jgi:hypothetical protein
MTRPTVHIPLALTVALALLVGAGSARADQVTTAPGLFSFSSGVVVPNGHYELDVNTAGQVAVTRAGKTRQVTLPRATFAEIKRELAATHFAHLKRRYSQVPTPITGVQPATIEYQDKTVTVLPGATAPKALDRLIDTLRTLAGKLS